MNIVSKRTIPHKELPEKWGEYEYFSKHLYKEDNHREVLFR
jgi:hypothetical protein